MKKLYFSFFTMCLILSTKAQLVEANHAPADGFKYDTYQCDSTGIIPGASGSGATWSFAPTTHSSVVLSYSATSINSPTYPSAKIGVAAGPTVTAYYKSDANTLWYYGGHIPVTQVVATLNYTSPAIYATYPMSLNTTSSAATGGTLQMTSPATLSGTFTGVSSFTADGSGTLTVAGTTYTDALRVVTEQNITFTTSLISGSVIQKRYEYYSIGVKAPIFSISNATVNAGAAGTSTQTIVSRLKSSSGGTGIEEVNSDELISVYPNPAVNEVRFLSAEKNLKVSIYDITGKLVAQDNMPNGVLKLDVSAYIKGLYIYRISNSENKSLATGKLTVIQ